MYEKIENCNRRVRIESKRMKYFLTFEKSYQCWNNAKKELYTKLLLRYLFTEFSKRIYVYIINI